MFPLMVVRHLARIASDHRLLLVDTEGMSFSSPKPFRFEKFWLHRDGADAVVYAA